MRLSRAQAASVESWLQTHALEAIRSGSGAFILSAWSRPYAVDSRFKWIDAQCGKVMEVPRTEPGRRHSAVGNHNSRFLIELRPRLPEPVAWPPQHAAATDAS